MFAVRIMVAIMMMGARKRMLVVYLLSIIVDAVTVIRYGVYVYAICLAVRGVIYANRVISDGDVLVHEIIIASWAAKVHVLRNRVQAGVGRWNAHAVVLVVPRCIGGC